MNFGGRKGSASVLDGAQDCVGARESSAAKKLKIVVHGGIVLSVGRGSLPKQHAVVVLCAEVGHVRSADPFNPFTSQRTGVGGELKRKGFGGLARIRELEDAGDKAIGRGREGHLLENRDVVLNSDADASLRFAQQRDDRVVAEGVFRLLEDGGDVLVLGINRQQDILDSGFPDSRRRVDQIRGEDYVGVEVGEEFGPTVGGERLAVNVHLRALGHHFVAAMFERVATVAVSVAMIAVSVIVAVTIAVTVPIAIAIVAIAVTVTVAIAVVAISIAVAVAIAVVAISIAVAVTVTIVAVAIAIAVRPSKRTRPLFGFFFGFFVPVYSVAVLLEAVHVLLGALPHTRQAEVGIAVKDEGGEKKENYEARSPHSMCVVVFLGSLLEKKTAFLLQEKYL